MALKLSSRACVSLICMACAIAGRSQAGGLAMAGGTLAGGRTDIRSGQFCYEADLALPLLEAIEADEFERFRLLLNRGADPNAVVPRPLPPGFAAKFASNPLSYYVTQESGVSALMLAAALGRDTMVKCLLAAGAERNRRSKPSGTSALDLSAKEGRIGTMRLLMGMKPGDKAAHFRVDVDIAAQRATAWNGGQLVSSTPISSGKASTPTQRGTYLVTDKHLRWKSTIFRQPMPYFLRLSCGDFGLHAGQIPGYPASHGCVRLPAAKAKEFYAKVPIGALVVIE